MTLKLSDTTPWTVELMRAHDAAHDQCARRQNPSTAALIQVAHGNGTFANAVAAAMLTLGGKHGPLTQTQQFLERTITLPAVHAHTIMREGGLVPGWGNSFVKGEHDSIWADVDCLLQDHQPGLSKTIASVTDVLHRLGKKVYPNPSCYTAACAIVMGIPASACSMLFLKARLQAWTEIFLAASG